MSYKALYRTYRPTTFDEVAGQKHIVQTLKNAIKENKIAHAYLFCGPRGTGKTTMARLFAKALDCEEGFGHQCNKCENCIAIMEGTHPDVIEIDAASNRGIDDIRDLINRVRYAPIRGQYKVYIIDEVHMLTLEAFNALLKTLEEPPKNVVFILATTEPFKLMPTILSRCQRYDFMKVSNADLLARLKIICEKENINAEEKALQLIVNLADGGVRDALSMLDQAIAYSGNNLQEHHINEIFGLSSIDDKIELLNAIKESDIVKITTLCENYTKNGIDVRRLTQDLLDILKDLLIYKNAKNVDLLKVLNASNVTRINFTNKEINGMIDVLLSANTQYRFVASSNSLFEVTLLKLASLENSIQEEVIEKKEKIISKPIAKEEPKEVSKATINTFQENNPFVNETRKNDFNDLQDFQEQGEQIHLSEQEILNIMVQASKTEKQIIIDAFVDLNTLSTNQKASKYIHTLKSCFPRIVSKNAIVFEATFSNIVSRTNIINNQIGFRKIIRALTGRDYLIICLSHDEYLANIKRYTDLNQVKKLPNPYQIDIDSYLKNNHVENDITQTEQFAQEILKGE